MKSVIIKEFYINLFVRTLKIPFARNGREKLFCLMFLFVIKKLVSLTVSKIKSLYPLYLMGCSDFEYCNETAKFLSFLWGVRVFIVLLAMD